MITVKNHESIAKMRQAGSILSNGLAMLYQETQVGVNCLDLERKFSDFLKKNGVQSNFLGYQGYPATLCISINDQLVHGIPKDRIIKDGDIVSIDAGCIFEDYHADAAFTKICGFPKQKKDVILVKATEQALNEAIKIIKPGVRIGDIGATIQKYIEGLGFHLPQDYTGHGIGLAMHEEPYIPNYGNKGTGMRLCAGMTIAIEPMVQIGTPKTRVGADHWTVYSVDHSSSAHFEATVLVTNNGYEVLTKVPNGGNY